MTILFYVDGSPLPLTRGLPSDYNENLLSGSAAFYYRSPVLFITLQEVETGLVCFRLLNIQFYKPVKIKCKHQYNEKVLYARTVLDHPAKEWVKGGGTQIFHKKQMSCLFGMNWQSLLSPDGPVTYVFFDMVWKEGLLQARLKKELMKEMQHTCPGIPNRVDAGRLYLSPQMDKMLHIFRNFNYAAGNSQPFLEVNMDRYLVLLLNRIANYNYAMLNIKQCHWDAVERACDYIGNNTYEDFTIPQLSAIALASPTNLKRYFLLITGFTIDDFKTYLRLKPALFQLAATNKQIKEIYSIAHYTSASSFCAGFRKVFLCSPMEVRSEEWDISFL